MSNKIFTIQQSYNKLSARHKGKSYIIGFRNVALARKVQYSIHPEPVVTLVRGNIIQMDEVSFDCDSVLYIPKCECEGSILEPMNDGGHHMDQYDEKEFILNLTHKNGLVFPSELIFEDDIEFVFAAAVFDPIPTIHSS